MGNGNGIQPADVPGATFLPRDASAERGYATVSRLSVSGPALGMFEVFGRTGPPILGGRLFWTQKKFPYKLRRLIVFHTLQYRRLRNALILLEGLECAGGRGSAPDLAAGAHDAPPDPLVGWEGAPA